MGNSISLEEELINLKITSKQMQRASKKCESNEKAAVNKLKKVGWSFCRLSFLLLLPSSLSSRRHLVLLFARLWTCGVSSAMIIQFF